MAEYLHYLDKNKTAYNSYFAWKENIVFEDANGFCPICDMCIRLNLDKFSGVKKSIIEDIGGYWDKTHCDLNLKDLRRKR